MLPWYYRVGFIGHRGFNRGKNHGNTLVLPWYYRKIFFSRKTAMETPPLPWYYRGKTNHVFFFLRFYRGNTVKTTVIPRFPTRFYRGKS